MWRQAETAAGYVMSIISKAGFPDIDVAVWEWSMNFSSGPKIPSLNPLIDGVVTEFSLASTLPLMKSQYGGTVALYLRLDNGSDDVLALTPAHVARPPSMHTSDTGYRTSSAGSITRRSSPSVTRPSSRHYRD